MSGRLLLAFLLAPLAGAAQDGLCPAWSTPEISGRLDVAVLPEASGIEVSADGSLFYLMNDGTTPVFDLMRPDGSETRRVRVSGFRPRDLEDLALGPCGQANCLYLGDIGDNATRRDTVQFALVEERAEYPAEVAPLRIVRARYADGPRDAEAMAVDPEGTLWLVTKTRFGEQAPAQVFRLGAEALAAEGVQTLEFAGEIPAQTLTGDGSAMRLITSMDIAPDGRRFLLLTYDKAFEIGFALAGGLPGPGHWIEGETHRAIDTAALIQAEAIAYTDRGRALIYTTESLRGSAAPLVRQTCP